MVYHSVIGTNFIGTRVDVMTYEVCAVGEREEWENLGNLFVVEDVSPRELDLRANLRPVKRRSATRMSSTRRW